MFSIKKMSLVIVLFTFQFSFAGNEVFNVDPFKSLNLAKQKVNDFQWFVIDGMFSDLRATEVSFIPGILKNTYNIQNSTLIFPSTFHDLENQSQYIYQASLQNYKKNKKKIIFLAQSRGAHILFHTFLKHPDLIDITYKAVYIQGAFYGSPLADISLDSVNKIAKIKSPLQKDIQALLKLLSPSAEGLRSDKARLSLVMNVSAAYKNAPDKINEIQTKTWFIRSQKPTHLLDKKLMAAGIYLTHYFGENDGVVMTKQQLVPGWGIDMGVIPVGHLFFANDPTKPSPDTLLVLENIIDLLLFDLAMPQIEN